MSQTSYGTSMATGFAGLLATAEFREVESSAAQVAIPFGRAVAADPGDVNKVHLPVRDVGTITNDADFSADNVITVTINGVACAPVTYGTSHAATCTALLAAIQANAQVTSASKSANGRVWTIESSGISITSLNMTISGGTYGGSAPAYDFITPQNDVFRGISVHRNNVAAQYSVNDIVDVLRKGRIWVETAVAVTADDTAYVDIANGLGKLTNVSTNNLATGGKFRSTVGSAGLAVLEINLP